MATFMYVYRIFISVVLLLVYCEVTVEQATHGPLLKICTTTWFNTKLMPTAPRLAEEDEDVINALLGCSKGILLPPSCSIGFTDAVTCDCYLENHKRCRVVRIDFSNRRLEGEIPEKIGNLQYLTSLYLNGNKLRGSIPGSFQHLKSLLYFSLCDNSLKGRIPTFLGQMPSLRSIYLCKNFFDQTIPPELGSLPSLEYLDLSYNFLSGKIPDQLGNIKSLLGLYLIDNKLSDKLPDQLGNLVNLEELNLQNNEFIGPLPSTFKSLKKLTYFNVRGNSLGEIKLDIFKQWQDLRIMNLMGNRISSPFHDQFPKLKSLTELYITDVVGESSSFPDLSGMKFLRILTLRNCSIADRIPKWIWNLSGLQYLDLSFNSLFGGIPEEVDNSLNYIFLRKNKLNQIIPAWMNDTPFVDVSENLIKFVNISPEKKLNPDLNLFKCCRETDEVTKRDQVDFDCKNGTQIYDRLYINCGGESVTVNGTEYEADIQPHGQSTFFKSKRSNWGYSSMGNFLWASGNKYILNDTCQIHAGDAQLYRTARLSSISLKYYGFCLKNGTYDVNLHFAEISGSENKDSHSKAGRLFDVDIQGENVLRNFNIETEAKDVDTAITKPFKANVNNSQLEIHLYWSGKGSVSYPSVYYGPLISAITVTPVRESELPRGVLAGISGFALFLLILFIGFWWRFEDKLRREELELVELYPGGLYNYKKIRAATKNFDIANRLCGGVSGTVYKGTLSDGIPVAVKKLSETKEGMREFAETSGTIAGIKHPNLVTLMGCCAGKNQLLLIYEYIGTTSLEDALFGSDDELRARLDWQTRCKICLGLAEGLSFLHEGSKLDIIHGDIKPENILLDDDLNPKIDNFGFARLYHKQKSEGTSSYTAPEVKDRPLEASADVYSFAVVMLVLFSGRKIKTPRAGAETVYLVDEAQIKNENGTLMELVDQNLNYNWDDAEVILTLAMKCLKSPPSSRDTMATIVEKLKKLRCTLNKPEGD
ncbi:probable LRR receptor-like serine/threonine-protein kinase At1g53420 isoform X4 [Capsicum annuum]|uniref:probable LRR receptor-like serine/threonine-protein kinase At1g53420 isoform X4 n=1 Tax=Capsicum annuum TaxID=4072 RepID=UPI001FB17593|nr:probable LRR receptor-like serine/threonine-protein kinase At1g53420 isoform X4 [Capsicum annuum]